MPGQVSALLAFVLALLVVCVYIYIYIYTHTYVRVPGVLWIGERAFRATATALDAIQVINQIKERALHITLPICVADVEMAKT